jgi:hypothetical protein
VNCLASTNTATFREELNVPITSPEPSDPSQTQRLASFAIQVLYDPDLVCVELIPGPAASGMLCTVEDSRTAPSLDGLARIGCVTTDESVFPDTTTPEGRHLADLVVRPQPELYSVIHADQDNGVIALLLDQNCALADHHSHGIPFLSCDDASVTIRYLEGDVVPDCIVDLLDTQAVAFAVGSNEGDALYNERYDLVPPGGDGRIDTNDLQFVTGRFGSTCAAPHPPQDPR